MLTGLSVAREREQGTFDQLLVTPFRPVEIMAGKALAGNARRDRSGDDGFASGAAMVPNSVRGVVCHACTWA